MGSELKVGQLAAIHAVFFMYGLRATSSSQMQEVITYRSNSQQVLAGCLGCRQERYFRTHPEINTLPPVHTRPQNEGTLDVLISSLLFSGDHKPQAVAVCMGLTLPSLVLTTAQLPPDSSGGERGTFQNRSGLVLRAACSGQRWPAGVPPFPTLLWSSFVVVFCRKD